MGHQALVELLSPLLSDDRRQRIEAVLNSRLLSVTVVLEKPHDPHNAAAVLRSCEAFGLCHVHVIEAEPFAPSRRVTRTSHKWLRVVPHADSEICVRTLESWGFRPLAAVPPSLLRGRELPSPVLADRPLALLFGNEHAGLSEGARTLCHGVFSLPMFGFCESFNLSVSVALALAQVTAARRQALGQSGDLPPEAMEQLRAAYYARSTPYAADVVLRHLRRSGDYFKKKDI